MIKKNNRFGFVTSFLPSQKGLLVLATGLLLSACTNIPAERPADIHIQPEYSQIKQEVSKQIRKLMRKHKVQGVSIALIDDQRTVWAQGFGYADVEKKILATKSTVYRVGSISKLFTATAAMQLTERGRMDIDKPLTTYLPQFSMRSRFAGAEPITPRNIMTHHSGLPDNHMKGMWGDKQANFEQLPSLIKNEYVAYPPNKIFAYSNLGVSLLGLAVQNVSGQSFVSYMDKHVLHPMGMNQSSFALTPRIRGKLSQGYKKGKAGKQPILRDLPAGSLYSNVEDLARFSKMVFAKGRSNGHRIIKSKTLVEMLRPQNENVPLDMDFHMGLGWLIIGENKFKGSGPVVRHDGGTIYFMTSLNLIPKHKLGVVVLTNSKEGALLLDEVSTKTLKMALAQKTGITQPVDSPVSERKITPFKLQSIHSAPGYYATLAGPVLIKANNGALFAEVLNRKFQFESYEDGTFGAYYRLLGIIKIRGPLKYISFSFKEISGHKVLVAHTPDQSLIVGEKLKLPKIPESWRERLGDYKIVNPDKDILIDQVALEENNSALQVRMRLTFFTLINKKAVTMTLLPVSDTDAIIAGLGRGKRETIRTLIHDGVEHLHYSGYEFKKVDSKR